MLLVGAAAYLAGLVATLPARLIVEDGEGTNINDVAGTIWNGEAGLAGGGLLAWRWAPLRSLVELGFAVDWTLTGDRTSLAGRARLRPGRLAIESARGSASLGLLAAVAPRLPFACDGTAQLDLRNLRLGGDDQRIEGRMLTDPASCAPKASANLAAPLPALLIEATPDGPATRLRVVRQALRRATLADVRIAPEGGVSATISKDGATLFPFLAPPGGTVIETTL